MSTLLRSKAVSPVNCTLGVHIPEARRDVRAVDLHDICIAMHSRSMTSNILMNMPASEELPYMTRILYRYKELVA